MRPRPLMILALTALPLLAFEPPRAISAQVCATCHSTVSGNLRGYLEEVKPASNELRLKLDGNLLVLHYDPAALKVAAEGQVRGAGSGLRDLRHGQAVRVEYTEQDGAKTATLVAAKPPTRLQPADLVSTRELLDLVAQGPAKGGYFLYDARPPSRFNEGSIPTAVNLPFTEFGDHADLLPADKGARVIFFCHGRTCNMSPCALARARSLGYTRVQVYQEGMTAWYSKHYGVVSPASFQEAYVEADVPAIVLDLRPPEVVARGFIPGAVCVAPDGVKGLLAHGFPPARLRPPILVVDEQGGTTARAAAMELVRAGYAQVNVLTGGFRAWTSASLALDTGAPALKAAYVPRLRLGAIPGDTFTRTASQPPAERKGVLILDVRSRFEAQGGMIPGALNIPQDELEARLPEIPKDRRLLIHCSTGAHAERAYRFLAEKGYDAAFLDAEITIIDTGEFIVD